MYSGYAVGLCIAGQPFFSLVLRGGGGGGVRKQVSKP